MAIYELLPEITTKSGEVVRVVPKVVGFFDREVPTGVIDGKNTTFVLVNTPIPFSEHVYLNGLLQEPGTDYNLSGNLIVFITNSTPEVGDLLQVSGRYQM
jgi:hypothetical protein